ncbi:MAG: 30S ribosomal protein S8 [Gammaproteobacteria bacterium]|nr:30S ribosomal protein S8 [Gammaproteobacteria bacterium]
MSLQDPIADMLTRIRNAQSARHGRVSMPTSRQKVAISEVLHDQGYIASFQSEKGVAAKLIIELKYHEGEPVIVELNRVSRPGLRIYSKCNELPSVRGGFGVAVVSTNLGVMTDAAARRAGVGGEVLCTVF